MKSSKMIYCAFSFYHVLGTLLVVLYAINTLNNQVQ